MSLTSHPNIGRREVILATFGAHRRREPDDEGFVVLARSEMEDIASHALTRSTADACQIDVTSTVRRYIRFAANQLMVAGDLANTTVAVQSWIGKKHAVVQVNDVADTPVAAAVSRSEELARLGPDDPESMPPLGAQTYQPVSAFFDSTASVTPAQLTDAAMTALGPARSSTGGSAAVAAGYIVLTNQSQLSVNKAGMSAYHRSTGANYSLTARTPDGLGSGWAAADEHDWSKIDPQQVSARAIDKALRSRNAAAIEPGRYTVILEPQAVGDLVQLLNGYLGAREADEGRSPFTKPRGGSKIGEKVADARVTLTSDPADPLLLSAPFDSEGFPLNRRTWIKNGVLSEMYYTRFWAKKQGKQPTGEMTTLKLEGGSTSVEDMIKSTDRGILVTRLWYLREVDPRTALYTGLTRDGTFLIERGAVTRSIKNFRFNESPVFLLNNIESIGPAVRLAGTEEGGDVAMPTIKAHDFNFTSLSDAV